MNPFKLKHRMEKAEQKQTAQTGTHIHTPSLRDL